jgi:hypothetical protein
VEDLGAVRRNISKPVGQEATDELKRTSSSAEREHATDEDLPIPGMAATVARIKQGRPCAAKDAFRQAMAKG